MKNLNQLFLGSVQVFLVLSGSMILSVMVGNIESLLSAVGQDEPKSYSILSGLGWVLLLLPMIWTFTMIRAQASEASWYSDRDCVVSGLFCSFMIFAYFALASLFVFGGFFTIGPWIAL